MAISQDTVIRRNILGSGPIAPFRRVGRDFATATGEELVKSAVRQILGTRPGELPWRPDFGVNLERFRHQNATAMLADQIRDEVVTALVRWEPRISVANCAARVDNNIIYVKVSWVVVSAAGGGSNVLIGPVTQQVEI